MKNSKVAVIGGAGFLGSHLVEYLVSLDCEVIVLDNLISGRKDFIHPRAKFIWCDITHSESSLYKIFKSNNIEYVFNYAAEPYVPNSFERPLHVFDINARGALMVMNSAHEAGVKGILQVSSAEIYGNLDGKITEEDKPEPHSTYGASKLAIDTLVQCRYREAKCPVIALRQFNCLGERDTLHPYIIPEIYTQATRASTIFLGNNTYRDFIYAKDAVKIAVELLMKGKHGEVYNLGSEIGVKMYDLALMVGDILGKSLLVIQDPKRVRPWDINHLQSDNSKIYKVVDSRPEIELDEALRRTIRYYQENPDKWAF